jgi:hypothetical protein
MPFHNRKLKVITFTAGGIAFQTQVQTWNLANNTEDGEKIYSFAGPGPIGEDREETDPDYALEATFYADWRSDGVSDWATAHDGETVAFVLEHHPDIPEEHVTWSGDLIVKAPNVGGDARTTEMSEVTWPIIGKPVYAREI